MKTVEFLEHLRSLDILLHREGDKLRISAPKDAMTPELRDELARRKAELLDFLSRSVAPESEVIERVARTATAPVSFAQRRLWFLDQLTPGSAAYIIPMGVRLRGSLDTGILQRSMDEILRRHEVLRTVFTSQDGVPNQSITPPKSLPIPLTDLTHLSASEALRQTDQLAAENAQTPFDLEKGPLLRARLVRWGEHDHVLLISIHHIVFDAWSVGIFTGELSHLYNALRRGESPALTDLEIQYVDFAAWQRTYLSGAVREKQLSYWKQKLGGKLPTLNLPADRPRQEVQTAHGGKCPMQVAAPLAGRLREIAQKEGATLAMILLTTFKVLLGRLSGQQDILVGMPVAGRNRKETETLIGFFVNTLVIRSDLSGSPSFRQLLAQVRNSTFDAFAHQDMPFEELLEVLAPHRDLNRTPVFQVFFNHLNVDVPRLELEGVTAEPFGAPPLDSKFDLTLYTSEAEGGLGLLLVYNADLFEEGRMRGVMEQYHMLLEQICANPDCSVERYSILTPGMRRVLPDPSLLLDVLWNGAVHDKVRQHAERTPKRIAMVDAEGSWTYEELERLSAGLGGWLKNQGIGCDDVVAVYGHRSTPLVLALLGILRAQAAFCILDPAHPPTRLRRCLEAARPKAWIQIAGAPEPPDLLKSCVNELTAYCQLKLPPNLQALLGMDLMNHEAPPGQTDPDSTAYVTFTSGTTGEPKCIHGTHRPLSHFMDWHCRQFGFSHADRFSMLSGLSHDPLLRDIFASLWSGGTLCIPTQDQILSPGQLTDWMRTSRITVSHLTPALSTLLTELTHGARGGLAPDSLLSNLHFAFFGGDTLRRRDTIRLHRLAPGAQIINFYGTTETPQAMAWHRVAAEELNGAESDSEAEAWPVPIGKGIHGAQVLVLDKAGGMAGVGEVGEIFVRTPYLSQGYANDPALTAQRFVGNSFTGQTEDRLYRTGDLGRYRPDGAVEFCGRGDHQLKIRGYRVELGEIEAALGTHSGVWDCAVTAQKSQDGVRLAAWVVPDGSERPTADSLRSHLRAVLPDFMVPSAFGYLDALPLTPNGKINRNALPVAEFSRPELSAGYVPPRNSVERVLAKVWGEVMGLEKVGVFDNFFDLGGHSLSATQLIARLRATLQMDLPLRSIFITPTIAELAKHIRYDAITRTFHSSSEIPRWNCLIPIQPRGSRRPLFLVSGAHADEDALLRFLAHLIPHVGLDQPVYGFKPRGLDGQAQPQSSVEEIARDYLAEVREFLPEGPYLLAGECVGGVVAFEMAQQLRHQGQEVALLALLDTERPTAWRAFQSRLRCLNRVTRYRLARTWDILKSPPNLWWRRLLDFIGPNLRAHFPKTSEDHVLGRIREVENGYARLTFRYRAQSYPGRVALIVNERAHHCDADLGWSGVPLEGLNIYCVPGDHVTRLTLHGKIVAAQLLKCIDEARREREQANITCNSLPDSREPHQAAL